MSSLKRVVVWGGGAVVLTFAGGVVWLSASGMPKYDREAVTFSAEPTPGRLVRGKQLGTLMCASCHADPATGKLTGQKLHDVPAWSRNITQDPHQGIGSWTDVELAYLLRTGVSRDGSYVPPHMVKLPHMADEDLKSVIVFLRSEDPLVAASPVDPPGKSEPSLLLKLLARVAFRKLPWPTEPIVAPPISDHAAHGHYLVTALNCYGCHSASFQTVDELHPEKSAGYLGGGNELLDMDGKPIFSANLTFDETGLKGWTQGDFVRALRKGFRPDNRVLGYPMLPMPHLTDEEAAAIYVYLKTVPAVRHEVRPSRSWGRCRTTSSPGPTFHRSRCSRRRRCSSPMPVWAR